MIPNPQQYHMTRLRRVPSAAHSPSDLRVRLGAGTRNVNTNSVSREAADDLNHNVFASSPPNEHAAYPRRPRGRSSSLRCGRSTSTPTAEVHRPSTGRNEAKQQNNQRIPPFTGV